MREEIKYTFADKHGSELVDLFFDGEKYFFRLNNEDLEKEFLTLRKAIETIREILQTEFLKVVDMEIKTIETIKL